MPVWGEAQTLVNKEWEAFTGVPDTVEWTSSTVEKVSGTVTVVGNTLLAPNQTAFLVTQYDSEGNTKWQISYQHNGNSKNYATAVVASTNGEIYVTGVSANNSFLFDFLTMKIDDSGNILWASTYDGGLADIPSAITLDNNGKIWVVGASIGLSSQSDYTTIEYDDTGAEQWVATYDYVNLHDAPIGIAVLGTGNIVVTGASASTTNNYDYATVEYNASGLQVNVNRQLVVGAGLDQPHAIKRDNMGNIYITGEAANGANKDIRTLKLSSNLALQWSHTIDVAGGEDVGHDLVVDNAGNVYVTGYVTNPDGGHEYLTVKYDALGAELWRREMEAIDSTQKAEAYSISLDNNDNVLVAGKMEMGGQTEIVTIAYDSSGEEIWLQNLGTTSNGHPINIEPDDAGSVYLSGIIEDININRYVTAKYEVFTRPDSVVYNAVGIPSHRKNEIIVSFLPDSSVLNFEQIYNKRKIWGTCAEFLHSDVIIAMEAKIGQTNLSNAKLVKIYPNFTPNDTVNISRSGHTYRMPEFWATLLLILPETSPTLTSILTDENEISDSLKSIREYIVRAEPNLIFMPQEIKEREECYINANDDDYAEEQKNLHFNPNATQVSIDINGTSTNFTLTPDANMNIEGAWDITSGDHQIKVGVIDSGIRWKHPDLGGAFGVVVTDGFNYIDNKPASQTIINGSTHGTKMAGIIGALRNNNYGVAGIAGGSNSPGVQLHDFLAGPDGGLDGQAVFRAIVDGSTHSVLQCDILNMSFGTSVFSAEMKRAIDFAYLAGVILVGARGNADTDDHNFPGTFPDEEVICVGAGGLDGNRKEKNSSKGAADWGSNIGKGIDVLAPGETNLIASTTYKAGFLGIINHQTKEILGATSGAAAEISGLAALLLSATLNQIILEPEDVEYFIERFADNRNLPPIGATWRDKYDELSGFGMTNASASVHAITDPDILLEHRDMSNTQWYGSGVTPPVWQNVVLNMPFDCQGYSIFWGAGAPLFLGGKYIVDIYHNSVVFDYTPPPGMVLDEGWALNRRNLGVALPPIINNEFVLDCRTFAPFSSFYASNTQAEMEHFKIHIKSNATTGLVIDEWFPGGSVDNAFSLLWRKSNLNGIDTHTSSASLSLQPNPATNEVKVGLENSSSFEVGSFAIIDVQGRILQSSSQDILSHTFNVENLAPGYYWVTYTTPTLRLVKPLLIQ